MNTVPPEPTWKLPADAVRGCIAVRKGSYRSADLLPLPEDKVFLEGPCRSVAEQSESATCAAHAVASLVAFAEDPLRPPRLSPQFLFDSVKCAESEWVERNLSFIRSGMEPDDEFLRAFRRPYEWLKRTLSLNGGLGCAVAEGFLAQFETQLKANTGVTCGSWLHRYSKILKEQGVCLAASCPNASVQRLSRSEMTRRARWSREILAEAAQHRVREGLYLLAHPNCVNDVRRILAGGGGYRQMPVCAALDLFEGKTDGFFDFPEVGDDGTTANRPLGLHVVLLVGYTDDAADPGGGHFVFLNSWGKDWGDRGLGHLSYAYFELFCQEAGTIRRLETVMPGVREAQLADGGRVCSVCGKSYASQISLRFRCEEPGCEARICFDCYERKSARRCQSHVSKMPK